MMMINQEGKVAAPRRQGANARLSWENNVDCAGLGMGSRGSSCMSVSVDFIWVLYFDVVAMD
jgi:hypothetical protein